MCNTMNLRLALLPLAASASASVANTFASGEEQPGIPSLYGSSERVRERPGPLIRRTVLPLEVKTYIKVTL